jgi:poly-gamma-glutamate capsule biosynthesis protein CapA/YwtB (metallophosphatase superfamily)
MPERAPSRIPKESAVYPHHARIHRRREAAFTRGDGENYTFTFPPSTAALLYDHNIRVVNLGNNHILNFKLEGLDETKHYLADAHIQYFGNPDDTELNKIARVEINSIPFSFVNWSDWASSAADMPLQIKSEHDARRIVVVYTHWGEEYLPATKREKKLAHEFIDEGADIVIGSHPHVVQEHEMYKGKNIYYSLGNMIFDQYFDDAVTHGLMLQVTFSTSTVQEVKEIPVVLQKSRITCPNTAIHTDQMAAAETK